MNFLKFLKPGVLSGMDMNKLFYFAKIKYFALPAINCIDTNSINSVLESAKKSNTVVIVQFSFSGSCFFIGKNLNKKNNIKSAIYGSVLGAKYIHEASIFYKIPVILHTDHCTKNYLSWLDGLLEYDNDFYKSYGKSLFSSHMIDLSQCNIKENIDICCLYLKKFKKLNINLEIELGCTGGEEDGLDNRNISRKKLYTNSKDVLYTYSRLIKISNLFTIAASFGNVHGVYKADNIRLLPDILWKSQKLIKKMYSIKQINPLNFVFHGGSGTSKKNILKSIKYGVVKINLDTDIQWSSWKGILNYYLINKYYLKSQLGNPDGDFNPNKKFYDPRIWLRYSQKYIIKYLIKTYKIFNCFNLLK